MDENVEFIPYYEDDGFLPHSVDFDDKDVLAAKPADFSNIIRRYTFLTSPPPAKPLSGKQKSFSGQLNRSGQLARSGQLDRSGQLERIQPLPSSAMPFKGGSSPQREASKSPPKKRAPEPSQNKTPVRKPVVPLRTGANAGRRAEVPNKVRVTEEQNLFLKSPSHV